MRKLTGQGVFAEAYLSEAAYPAGTEVPAVPGSRLGILREDMPDTLPEGIEGLHFHVLCENDSYALERCLKATEEKFSDGIQYLKRIEASL